MPPLTPLMVFTVFIFAICIFCVIIGLLVVLGMVVRKERSNDQRKKR